MKDKEIIEEMAKIIRPVLTDRTHIVFIPALDKPIAQELYEQGYRKLPEDSVVLPKSEHDKLTLLAKECIDWRGKNCNTVMAQKEDSVVLSKEEYEKLKSIEKSYDPFWFCTFGGCEGACKECKDTCEMSIFVKERKETAEKFANEVYKKLYQLGKIYALPETLDADKYGVFSLTQEVIVKIAKEQFDVEIKE